MLRIDSGDRVIKLDPSKVDKIIKSWNPQSLADIYLGGSTEAQMSLNEAECLAFIKVCYPPTRCHFRGSFECWWSQNLIAAPARCIRCRLAALYLDRTDIDLRTGERVQKRPGCGYAVALLTLTALTYHSILSANKQSVRADRAERALLKYSKQIEANKTHRRKISKHSGENNGAN